MKKIALGALSGMFAVVLFTGAELFAQYTPEQILKIAPTQSDVAVDTPAANEVANCKIIEFKEGKFEGVCLTKPDGSTALRVWCAKSGSDKVEQVRFYRNGVEVFRDILGSECRWLNDGGSRRAAVDDKGTITKWLSISPEETTAEVVAALVTGDLERYKRVALSANELGTLGISGSLAAELKKQIESVDQGFVALSQKLKLPANIQWGAFNGSHPGLVPEGKYGIKKDLPVYFNSNIVLLNREDPSQTHQLYLGDIVNVDGIWKVVGLPTGEPFGKTGGDVNMASVFFPTQVGGTSGTAASGDYNELAEQINEAQKALENATPEQYPALCEKAYRLLITLAVKNPKEELALVQQAADLLFSAAQTGLYPQGVEQLGQLYEAYKGEAAKKEMAAHIRLRQIDANFYARSQATPRPKPAELEKAQTRHTEDLTAFAEEYPQTTAGATALMYLALNQEYLQEDEKAAAYYTTVTKHFAKSPIGQKAAGALNRLQSTGKEFSLPAWKFLEGGELNLAATPETKGKSTVIFCWASWTPDQVESMKNVLASNANVQVVGICLDNTQEEAVAYLKSLSAPLPWKNVFEKGGLESVCATHLGIQNLPLIILLDPNGKVVRSNIMSVEDLEAFLKSE